MPNLIEQLHNLVSAMHTRPDAEPALRRLRLELARTWATADAGQAARMSQTELRDASLLVRGSGLRSLALVPEEHEALAPWRTLLEAGWPSPELGGHMMACSLYLPMHELGLCPSLEGTPLWMLADHLQYLFERPARPLTPAESERYARHLELALVALEPIADDPGTAIDELVVANLDLTQAFGHGGNPRGLMAARGRLVERFLCRHGFVPRHAFSSSRRLKPRLGILAPTVAAPAEGNPWLAQLADLDRTAFEIILYGLHTPHSVLQPCREHADELVPLPEQLAEQVARIRGDDLDLALVMSDVTAMIDPMTLLCAHRLARVQVATTTSAVTTGLAQLDGFLSRAPDDGEEAQARHTEKLHAVGDARGSLTSVLRSLVPPPPATAPDPREALRARTPRLARSRVRSLSDFELVRRVLLPCFPASSPEHPLHMVDVGACYGQIAGLFLDAGWTADLYEPDPSCHRVMAPGLASFVGRAELHKVAVSDEPQASADFYKADTDGLSGLGPSPYGNTRSILQVPVVRLAEHQHQLGRRRVDFLKIDAEGQDLKVMASHDFAALPPRFVLIEVCTEFPGHDLALVCESLAVMRAQGYQALILGYEDDGTFKQGIWDHYWLKEALVGEDMELAHGPLMAGVVFYRPDDQAFLDRFMQVLDGALEVAA